MIHLNTMRKCQKPMSFKCSVKSVDTLPTLFEPLTVTVKIPLSFMCVNGELIMQTLE